jgi:hypothetical protein
MSAFDYLIDIVVLSLVAFFLWASRLAVTRIVLEKNNQKKWFLAALYTLNAIIVGLFLIVLVYGVIETLINPGLGMLAIGLLAAIILMHAGIPLAIVDLIVLFVYILLHLKIEYKKRTPQDP